MCWTIFRVGVLVLETIPGQAAIGNRDTLSSIPPELELNGLAATLICVVRDFVRDVTQEVWCLSLPFCFKEITYHQAIKTYHSHIGNMSGSEKRSLSTGEQSGTRKSKRIRDVQEQSGGQQGPET